MTKGAEMLNCRVVLAGFLVASCAFAGPITLHNTGAVTVGKVDSFWTIDGLSGVVTDNSGFPFGPWFDNTTVSQWLSPQPSYTTGQTDPESTFIYATSFDLAGFNPASALISLRWAVDNTITDILLNGLSIGHSFNSATFFDFSSDTVTIGSGFQPGLNTLQFLVLNGSGTVSNPAGLRVEFTSSDATTTPEPASFILIGAGLLGLAGAVNFRNKRDRV